MISEETRLLIGTLPSILSIQEVSDFLKVAYITVYRLVRLKKIAAYKDDDGNWCILRCDLEKFCYKNCNL